MSVTYTYNTAINVGIMYQFIAATNTYTSVNTTTGAYFTNTFAVGDRVIFGRQARMFDDLIPTVGTALSGTGVTGKWQYFSEYDESGVYGNGQWRDFPDAVTDGTNGLTTTGQNTVSFRPPVHWAQSDQYATNPTSWPSAFQGYFLVSYVITAVTSPSNGGANATNPVQCGNNTMVVTATTATTISFSDLNTAQPTIFEYLDRMSGSGLSRLKYDICRFRGTAEMSTNVTYSDTSATYVFTRQNTLITDSSQTSQLGTYESAVDSTKDGIVMVHYFLAPPSRSSAMGTGTLKIYDSKLIFNNQFGSQVNYPLLISIDSTLYEAGASEPASSYAANAINNASSILKRTRAGFALGFYAAPTIDGLTQYGKAEFGGQAPDGLTLVAPNAYQYNFTQFSGTYNYHLRNAVVGAGGIIFGNSATKNLDLSYQYDLNVVDSSNTNINGATVVINDTTGTNVTNTTTNSSGNIATQYLFDALYTGTNVTNPTPTAETPHTVYIGGYTYNTFTAVRNMTSAIKDSAKLSTDSFVSASYATASAYTGFAINWSTMVVTISSNHTYQELYDWLKSQYISGTNLSKSQPLTTNDGVNYTSNVDIVLNSGVSLTGSGKTLNLNTHKLTYSSATSSCSMTVYNGTLTYKATGTYSESYNTLTFDFQAAGSYDITQAIATGTLTFEDTTTPGAITVNVAPGVTTSNSDPTNITVVQATTVAVNFSDMSSHAQIRVTRDSDSAELLNTAAVSGAASFNYTYSTDVPCHYSVRDSSQSGTRYLEATGAFTIGVNGADITVNQIVDSNNTATVPAAYGWNIDWTTGVVDVVKSSENHALQFNGFSNYVTIGNLGALGSHLGDGVYLAFSVNTTATNIAESGFTNGSGLQAVIIGFNESPTGANASGKLRLFLRDGSGKILSAATTNSCNFNDGNVHNVVITANPATNTISITVDGVSQALTYQLQQTPASFANLTNAFYIGGRNNVGTADTFFSATIDDFKIGTSSSNLYGSYSFNEGTGTTTADSSGNGNTGTLSGSPVPSWVSGLKNTDVLTGEQLYAYLMSLADDSGNMQYAIPATCQVLATQYTLGTGWTFAANAEQFLKTGGWNYANGNNIYTNVKTLGASGRTVYVEQNSAAISSWWSTGNLDILIKVKSGGTLINSGTLDLFTRDFNYIYDHLSFDASGGGVSIQALTTGTDSSNQTASGTVSGYSSSITLTWGTTSKDIGDGTGSHNYNLIVDAGGLGVQAVYEYLKYITTNGNTSLLPPSTGVQGQLYTSVTPGSYTEVKNGPFGSFAGTKFFGAQGVWLQNMASGDSLNYQLIDSAGTTHIPPSFISVTGFVTGSRVYLYNTSGAASSAWSATHAYTVGQGVLRSTGKGTESGGGGLYFECTTAGTSGGSEPTWNTTVGSTTTDGSVTWTCRSIILNNSVITGTTTTISYAHAGTTAANRTIDCYVAYVNGTSAKNFVHQTGVITATGLVFTVTQTDHTVYNAIAVDGSTQTQFSISGTTLRVFINDGTTTTDLVKNAFAFWTYTMFTSQGIRDQSNDNFTATDTAHYAMGSGMKFKNTSSTALVMTGGYAHGPNGTTNEVIDTTGTFLSIDPANVEAYNANTKTLLTRNDFMARINGV